MSFMLHAEIVNGHVVVSTYKTEDKTLYPQAIPAMESFTDFMIKAAKLWQATEHLDVKALHQFVENLHKAEVRH